jgi:hypothetical protein
MVTLLVEHKTADRGESEQLKLYGRPGGAENVIAWQTKFPEGCTTHSIPTASPLSSPPTDVPDALCFWYENGTFLVAQIKNKMCEACFKVLVQEFVSMTASYTAGYLQDDGSWVDEDFDAEIYSPGVVNTIHPKRHSRVRQSSYEEIACLTALRGDGRPFYYDKVCLIPEYDPSRGIDYENERIRRETLCVYKGCVVNYGFEGGGNCAYELEIVGDKHRQLSRLGIYVSDNWIRFVSLYITDRIP